MVTGLTGGKFLKREQMRKPNQPQYGNKPVEYYSKQELFVGAKLELNKYHFVLIDADEYAKNYEKAMNGEVISDEKTMNTEPPTNPDNMKQHDPSSTENPICTELFYNKSPINGD